MRDRPLVGVTAAVDRTAANPWNDGAALVRLPYLRHVSGSGGVPVVLPPSPWATAEPDRLLDIVDAVLLTGGPDINPAWYGAVRDARTRIAVPERDEFELALARRAIERDVPLLGICRGMQLLNVALGGTLHQHLPDVLGHGKHHHTRHASTDEDYDVRLQPESLAARAAGAEVVRATASKHHQGVDRVGDGLVVSGWAVVDGLPVALELPDRRFVLGVQWHPEVSDHAPVIAALADAARENALARR